MIFSASCTQCDVVSRIKYDFCLCKYSIVLNLSFSNSWTIIGKNNKFSFTISKSSECSFIAKDILSTLHDERELAIKILCTCFLDHRLWIIIKCQILLIFLNNIILIIFFIYKWKRNMKSMFIIYVL